VQHRHARRNAAEPGVWLTGSQVVELSAKVCNISLDRVFVGSVEGSLPAGTFVSINVHPINADALLLSERMNTTRASR